MDDRSEGAPRRRRTGRGVRALGGAVAACTAAAGLALATGTPAHAATRLTLAADTPVSLAAGLGGQPGPANDLRAWANGPGLQPDARIQVRADVSGLAGLATVSWPAGCTPDGAGAAALCDVPAVAHPDDPGLVLSLRAAPGVTGGKGTVTFTGVSGNVAGQTVTSSVAVAGGPVALDGMPVRVSAKPGEAVPLPFRLANYGAQAADGEILELIPSHGLDIVGRSSGCGYEEGKDGHATWIVCYLDAVPSGRTVDYGHAVAFTATASSLIEDVEAHVYRDTPETRQQLARQHQLTPGTGPALAPDGSTEGVPAATPVTWADPKIDVDNVADLSVGTPSPRTAAKGATLDIDLSVTNHGPADYIDAWNENPAAYVEFVPPPGTTVTGFNGDTGCLMLAADDRTVVSGRDRTRPGERVVCPTGYYFLHGVTMHPAVKLHVDTVVPNATGKAFFRHLSPGGAPMPWDGNAANDTATLVLNPTTEGGTSDGGTASSGGGSTGGSGTSGGTTGTTGTTSGGTTGSATAGTSGSSVTSGSSGDGSLASTGTGAAPLLAAMAGTACAAGAAVLFVVRSRRRGDRGTGGATGV